MIDPGWKKCGPGIYVDEATGALHLDLNELLRLAGYPATARNLAVIERVAREHLAAAFPGVPAVYVDEGSPR